MNLLLFNTRPFRVRASTIVIAHFHAHSRGGFRPFPGREVIKNHEAWFVKVVATLFVRSRSLDACLGYLCENLTPVIAFEVIKRFYNPKVGLKFLEFSRLNLSLIHSFSTYNWLMRSLCQMGLYDLAKMVFDYMKSDGHLPDGTLLGFLVTSFVQAGKFDLARKLFADVQAEEIGISLFVYNSLLNELVKRNQVNEAICLFKEHLALQSPPDTWTFNILIRDRACDLLKEVQSRKDCSPDVVTYTSIISGFCKLGKMGEASVLFEEMIRSGINPNVVTFNVLIDGFGKNGDMVAAEAMHEKMVSFGCVPDVVTFTSLIDGYCRTGQVHLGLKRWDAMKARNVSPNVYTYAVLVNALCKENRIHEARGFLRLLKCSNVIPKPFIYNPVIDGYCKSGNVDEANVIVTEMEEKRCNPDKVTFTILIIGHCMKGRIREAIDIFNKMLAIGCAPDSITVRSLVSCLLKAGMPNEAFHIVQRSPEDLNLSFSSFRATIPLRTNADIPVAA
ncbi:hypothetical protein GH714_024060 [Hevea brasiliensis]|uniref:Pentacotripeptide-repeat region of PRORP domain-containing protein n=1 Tax=Hevea brasiliensis TaxID=3981 RepID=A0A6A6LC12_HEVBR|nr:hypothetical protein GH714_024060 [Hevea brasiliensis]